ncbi:MAG: transglycosylase SLT domain-containing protein [Halieaceae bacterium]|nr:transglycosylase SLT domain-containing protein [Halieaceae bacterium]
MVDANKPPAGDDELETTIIRDSRPVDGAGLIHVTWRHSGSEHKATFTESFSLGRDLACDICITDTGVSRTHAQIFPEHGQWHIKDLDSSNGSFLDSARVSQAVLPATSSLQLGDGPTILFNVPAALENLSEKEIAERYFSNRTDDDVGSRTLMVRDAFLRIEKKQKRRYRGIIAVFAIALIASLGVGWYQYQVLQKTRELATNIFYSMKAVEVQVAQIENKVRESSDEGLVDEANNRRQEVRALEDQYDQFLEELEVMGPDLSQEDRVILRVARMFGECELTMPAEFTAEVKKYIHKWRLSSRLRWSLERLHEQNLTEVVVEAMLANNLPPQFLYVALQESGFKNDTVGPKTRYGIAKGMWQFIPSTARRYGLRTGPLVELPVTDPIDDRHKPEQAAWAAARYLRDIYSKEAQASGLLVMASYNWGPNNIRKRIRDMPDNPRERNFWELLKQNDIPRETYDYVFYIVSAIVIGEDPALFGFKFDNPLRGLDQSLRKS